MPEVVKPQDVKLGKKLGVVKDRRTIQLGPLLDAASLPKIPATWRFAKSLHYVPMFGNDRYGDCTFASHGHRIVAQELSTSQREKMVTESDVLKGYADVTGFDPNRPETDNGAYMLDVANYMRRTGIGREKDGSAHTISAFALVDHTNLDEVKKACVLFGGVWCGAALPLSAQSQTGPGLTWDISGRNNRPGSWGGHAFTMIGYDTHGGLVYTWGNEQKFTWEWWLKYVDEVYALISEDWFRKSGTTSRGFNVAQLQQYLSELDAS